jgi:hypothetical protein
VPFVSSWRARLCNGSNLAALLFISERRQEEAAQLPGPPTPADRPGARANCIELKWLAAGPVGRLAAGPAAARSLY